MPAFPPPPFVTSTFMESLLRSTSAAQARQRLETQPYNGVVLPSNLDIDWAAGSYFRKTLSVDSTFTFSNVKLGKLIALEISGAGSNAVTWPAGISWPGESPPAAPPDDGVPVRYFFIATGASTFWGFAIPQTGIPLAVNLGGTGVAEGLILGGAIDTSDGGGHVYTYGLGGFINTSNSGGYIETAGEGGYMRTSNGGGYIDTSSVGGYIDTSFLGGSLDTAAGGGGLNTRDGFLELGIAGYRTTIQNSNEGLGAHGDFVLYTPRTAGTLALSPRVTLGPTTSGGAVTGASFCDETHYIGASGTLAAFTWNLPLGGVSNIGQIKRFQCAQAITALTVGGSATLLGAALTSAVANTTYAYQCIATASFGTWLRIQ